MIILPAIDLIGGKAVRLLKGDYAKMTVYSEDPVSVAGDFVRCGAEWIHLVDLEGARDGGTPNIETINKIISGCGLKAEVGGGIRNMQTIEAYAKAGVSRVVLGTAAVTDPVFLKEAVDTFGKLISVGVDIKESYVAIKGWTEKSSFEALDFCKKMQDTGVSAIICTDISRDGAMKGTNRELYRTLSEELSLDIIASGGVSSMEDVLALRETGLYGAIIGKAYYTGAIDLAEAILAAKESGVGA